MLLHIYLLFIATKIQLRVKFYYLIFDFPRYSSAPFPARIHLPLPIVGLQLLQEQQQQHEKYMAQFMMALSSFGIVIKVINMDAPLSVCVFCLCFVVSFSLSLSLYVLACVFHLFALLAYLFILLSFVFPSVEFHCCLPCPQFYFPFPLQCLLLLPLSFI